MSSTTTTRRTVRYWCCFAVLLMLAIGHQIKRTPQCRLVVQAFSTRTVVVRRRCQWHQRRIRPSGLTPKRAPPHHCHFSVLSSHQPPHDSLRDYYNEEPLDHASSNSHMPDEATIQYWRQIHGLNEAQTTAVTQPLHAVTRVVAGPGSGKTRVLTCRIAHLLQQAPSRDRVLAVTFTRKAAGEMQQRLEALLATDADPDIVQQEPPNGLRGEPSSAGVNPSLYRVTLGTFHSVCAKILRWNGDLLASLPSVTHIMRSSANATALDGGFIIVDQAEQLRILKECLLVTNIDLKNHKDMRPFHVLSAIGKAKAIYAVGGYPFALEERQKKLPPLQEIASKVYPLYVQKLLSTNALDFDDLILMARELLSVQPDVREMLRRRWQHVLIDEFQDTSRTQMDLVKLLTSDSLFVVGDADQSIYSWRGAHVGSLQDLEKDFGDVNTVYLMENYRSTANIVKAAQKIISSSSGSLRQDMKPKRGAGPAPRVVACSDDKEEAGFVIEGIKDDLDSGKYSDQHEVALIYRTNAQSRVLEEACVQHNLPYVQFGSATSFYKRQEIKDTLCYLRWLYNGMDRGSMLRAFKTPAKGLGEKAIEEFDEYCSAVSDYVGRSHPGMDRPNPFDVLLSLAEENPAWVSNPPFPADFISTRPLKLFKEFAKEMRQLRDMAYEEPLENVIARVLAQFRIFPHLDKISKTKSEYEERRANVRELQNAAQRYTADGPCLLRKSNAKDALVEEEDRFDSPLGNYLDDVALVTDMADQGRDSEDKRFKVCLMTIHASKGMEFDTVYVVGNEEGTFPTSQSITEGEGSIVLEEEKRLCYVAMTRAKTELILTWRKEVPIFTSTGIHRVSKDRSRFLDVLVSKKGKKSQKPKTSSSPKKRNTRPSSSGTNAVFSKKSALERRNDGPQMTSRRSSSATSQSASPSAFDKSQQRARSSSPPPSKFSTNTFKPSSSRPRERQMQNRPMHTGTQSVFSGKDLGRKSVSRSLSSPPPRRSTTPQPGETARTPTVKKQEMDSTWFFPVGSKVKHTRFGEGIVLSPPPPQKEGDMPVLVQFPNGERREFSAHGTDLSPILI